MAHQSGIRVSQELADSFSGAVASGKLRIIHISIENESLVLTGSKEVKGSWESDFVEIQSFLEEKTPAYVLYRLDSKSHSGDYEWLFLAYVPDQAKVRDKMLYASTRATLTKDLGDYRFVDSIYGSSATEFTYEGYLKHKKHQQADAPLTEREKELAEIRLAEASSYSPSDRKSHAAGVSIPILDEAIYALEALRQSDRSYNLVQLSIDSAKETIELASTDNVEADQLAEILPEDSPRFAFFAFKHLQNGQEIDSIIFVYTCPQNSKIRERMLYSSCRASVISAGETKAGLVIAKKLETNDPSDLTKTFLLNELHPKKETTSRAFDRPKPPGRKSGRS